MTTDTAYLPAGFGPSETARQTETSTGTLTTLARTIDYDYDGLYRLISADYTSGEAYQYAYDPVGNRLQQIIDGDTTEYLYDAANRLAAVDGVSYDFDDNGNLLTTGSMTNTWDSANRLIEASRNGNLVQPIYNGVGDRIGQTVGVTTTHFALDVQGLPEVIYTSDGETFLHLPGVIVTESSTGEMRYLLSDGLGSVRQAVDENAEIVSYYEFDPYGNPVPSGNNGGEPYGYTGEWFESYTELLHLRARWYAPETGTFLSVDSVESEPPYLYVGGNSVNLTDPTGYFNCRHSASKIDFARCVLGKYGLYPASMPGYYKLRSDLFRAEYEQAIAKLDLQHIPDTPGCYSGWVPYLGPGYLEGVGGYFSAASGGTEVVYDFAAMEKRSFWYGGGMGSFDTLLGAGASMYLGAAFGFRSNIDIVEDYSEFFSVASFGIGTGAIPGYRHIVGAGVGLMPFWSTTDKQIIGLSAYLSGGIGVDLNPLPATDFAAGTLYYVAAPTSKTEHYASRGAGQPYTRVKKAKLVSDILSGSDSPWETIHYSLNPVAFAAAKLVPRMGFMAAALLWAKTHDDMYIERRY